MNHRQKSTVLYLIVAVKFLDVIFNFMLSNRKFKKLIAYGYEQLTYRFHVVPLWYTSNQQRQYF
jgi:hypothetical protein